MNSGLLTCEASTLPLSYNPLLSRASKNGHKRQRDYKSVQMIGVKQKQNCCLTLQHYSSRDLETKGPENIKIIHTLNLKREKIGELFTNVFMLPYFCFFLYR